MLVKALTVLAPPLATHTLPVPSMAMLEGAFSPLPLKEVPLDPFGLSSVIVLFPEFAIHAFPLVSTATAVG